MTQRFYLCIRRVATATGFRVAVERPEGIAIADTEGGDIQAAILGAPASSNEAARRLADAYRKGDFDPATNESRAHGIVLVDTRNLSSKIVMPRVGIRQVFYAATKDALLVSSSPEEIFKREGIAKEIAPASFFRYLYFHVLPSPESIFKGVFKLPAGHELLWNENGLRTERYWRPNFDANLYSSESDASTELRATIKRAVEKSLSESEHAGAFLSGGLDSSTVAGYAAQSRPGIQTITMGFEAEGYDEMAFARIASRQFSTRPLEYYVTPEDILDSLPRIASSFSEPFGNSSAAAVYQCARVAREHGIDFLLAGDGGDELFGGNDRYAKQLIFERYGRIPSVIRHSLLEPSIAAAASVTTRFPVGKAKSYVEQANVPLPDRLQHYNFLHQHPPEDVFTPRLLDSVDKAAPLEQLRDEYAAPRTKSCVNRMLFMDWRYTLHDNDLVKVNTMCDIAGVGVGYPMLDGELVDLSLRLPPHWKVHRGELRCFYKRAMRGFLPPQILDKTKHGFGLPFGVWTRTHAGLRRLSDDSLASLSGRGIFARDFLSKATRLHREGHASFYGELVWILTVLELWLQSHAPDFRLSN